MYYYYKYFFEFFIIIITLFLLIFISFLPLYTCYSSSFPSFLSSSSSSSYYYSNHLSYGINVYGWLLGDFGGGTTSRCLLQSLISQNISTSGIIINGAELHSHTNKMLSTMKISNIPQNYLFDLLVINAANTLPILQDSSNKVKLNHYRIGLWHWETSYLPDEQGLLGGYYDEIWAPSEYIAKAILATKTFPSSVRISIIPYGYETLSELVTNEIRKKSREQLLTCIPHLNTHRSSEIEKWSCEYCSKNTIKLMDKWSNSLKLDNNENQVDYDYNYNYNKRITLFLVIFDFNSDYQRKNILGIIKAFRLAFPHSGESQYTGLIIKSSNAKHQMNDFNYLINEINNFEENSNRIILMDGILSSNLLLNLKKSADCYISLHRSEGWGLNLLESVMMGIPVIHTAFGGSEQFMKPLYENILPELRIPYQMINVSRPFGPYTSSMQWADPNINASINSFIQLHYSLSKYHTSSAIIRSNAIKLLSPSTTGNLMNNRLSLIGYCLCFLYKLQPYYFYSYKCHPSIELNTQKKYSVIEREYQKYQQLYNYQNNNLNHIKNNLNSNSNNNNNNNNSKKKMNNEKIDLNKQPSRNIQKFCEEQILGRRVLYERYKRLK